MESFVEEKKEQEGVGQAAIAEQQRSVIFANNQAFGSDTWTETTKQTVVRILLREGKSNCAFYMCDITYCTNTHQHQHTHLIYFTITSRNSIKTRNTNSWTLCFLSVTKDILSVTYILVVSKNAKVADQATSA